MLFIDKVEMSKKKYGLETGRELEVVYIPRFMANVALPVRDTGISKYVKRNGRYELSITPSPLFGLPFGTYARLVMCHIATEVKLTSNHEVFMGNSISAFIGSLGKLPSGGDNGTLRPLKDQIGRLLASTFTWRDYRSDESACIHFAVPRSPDLCWNYTNTHPWVKYITLENTFYSDLLNNSVPVKWSTLSALSNKPMAFDLYCWLTYRFNSLNRPTTVTWKQLQYQFGNDLAEVSNFRFKMKKALKQVHVLYPEANVKLTSHGLELSRSIPHVRK